MHLCTRPKSYEPTELLQPLLPKESLEQRLWEPLPHALHIEIISYLNNWEWSVLGKISKAFNDTLFEDLWLSEAEGTRIQEWFSSLEIYHLNFSDLSIAERTTSSWKSIVLPKLKQMEQKANDDWKIITGMHWYHKKTTRSYEPKLPLVHLSDLVKSRFLIFERIFQIVASDTFKVDPCRACIQWPTRTGYYWNLSCLSMASYCLGIIGCFGCLLVNCCVALPASACCSSTGIGCATPLCGCVVCTSWSSYPEHLERAPQFQELKESLQARREELSSQFYVPRERQELHEFAQKMLILDPLHADFRILGYAPLKYWLSNLHYPQEDNPFRKPTGLNDLWIVNHCRLSLDIPSYQNDSMATLRQLCENNELDAVEELLLDQSINVNTWTCQEILLTACNSRQKDLIALFVQAGADLLYMSQSDFSAAHLQQLLEQGIFANDPTILDQLCLPYRYDLAFILFLYGFDSPKMHKLLNSSTFSKAAKLDYQKLVELRKTKQNEMFNQIPPGVQTLLQNHFGKPHLPELSSQLALQCVLSFQADGNISPYIAALKAASDKKKAEDMEAGASDYIGLA